MKIRALLALLIAGTAMVTESRADAKKQSVTVLAQEKRLTIEGALVDGARLFVPVERIPDVNGFELKPEGLCADDICIPIPKGAGWLTEREGKRYFDVTAFAKKVDQPVVAEPAEGAWSFAPVPALQSRLLPAGKAPDFELEDRKGKTVRLSDFRGKKVLILTWASW